MTFIQYKTVTINRPVSTATSTGKERDEETSYCYFGARYYDSDLSDLFLSVDPMSDKYPNISPYAYCAWNPVKYLDPDGRTIWLGEYDGTSQKRYDPNEKYAKGTLGYSLNNIYHGSKAGKFVINSLIRSGSNYFISDSRNPEEKNPCFDASNTQIFLNSNDYGRNEGTLSHELFHAFQHKEGQYNQSMDCEVEAFVFEGIVLTQLNGGKLPTAKQMSKGMFNAFTPVDRFNDMQKLYGSNMVSLIKMFNKEKMNYVVNNFSTFSISGRLYASKKYSDTWDGNPYSASNSLLFKNRSEIY